MEYPCLCFGLRGIVINLANEIFIGNFVVFEFIETFFSGLFRDVSIGFLGSYAPPEIGDIAIQNPPDPVPVIFVRVKFNVIQIS